MQTLLSNFEKYLKKQKVSAQTSRSYKADVKNFLVWLTSFVGTTSETIRTTDLLNSFTTANLSIYKQNQIDQNIPYQTINRRLSSIRFFGKYLSEEKIISQNPATIENIVKQETINESKTHKLIVQEFEKHLKKQNVSKVTQRNYLSDIRQFLNWIDESEKGVPNLKKQKGGFLVVEEEF